MHLERNGSECAVFSYLAMVNNPLKNSWMLIQIRTDTSRGAKAYEGDLNPTNWMWGEQYVRVQQYVTNAWSGYSFISKIKKKKKKNYRYVGYRLSPKHVKDTLTQQLY